MNSMFAPGACVARVVKSRPLGRFSMNSSRMLVERWVDVTSTTGASPVTVTSSWIVLTRSAMSTLRVCPSESRMPGTFTDVNPVRFEETS